MTDYEWICIAFAIRAYNTNRGVSQPVTEKLIKRASLGSNQEI